MKISFKAMLYHIFILQQQDHPVVLTQTMNRIMLIMIDRHYLAWNIEIDNHAYKYYIKNKKKKRIVTSDNNLSFDEKKKI